MSPTHRPCPACGGQDRFYLILAPHNGGDPYWRCRQCNFTEPDDGNDLLGAAGKDGAPPSARTPTEIAESQYAYTVVAERCAAALWKPDGRQALEALRRRGLSDATIRAARLGWCGDGRDLFTTLFYHDRAAYDGALTGGLRKSQGIPRAVLTDCITIPYFDGDRCILLRGRKLHPRSGDPKYLSPAGSLYAGAVPRFYLHETMGDDAVLLTEGEFKALAAYQAYIEGRSPLPCIATCGVFYLPPALIDALRGRIVYLAYDNEAPKPGQRTSPAAQAIGRNGAKLRMAGIPVKVVELPRPAGVAKVDLDSYLIAA
jgi:DNA primase